jgi:hypothetical protein
LWTLGFGAVDTEEAEGAGEAYSLVDGGMGVPLADLVDILRPSLVSNLEARAPR